MFEETKKTVNLVMPTNLAICIMQLTKINMVTVLVLNASFCIMIIMLPVENTHYLFCLKKRDNSHSLFLFINANNPL